MYLFYFLSVRIRSYIWMLFCAQWWIIIIIYLCSRLNTATKLPKITKCWLGTIINTMIMRMIIINNWMKLNTLQDLLDRPFSQWQYLTTTARIHLIRFGFLIQICKKKKYGPDLYKETTKWKILVVAVKWHHHTIIREGPSLG